MLDDKRLHTIVGHHLVLTSTLPGMETCSLHNPHSPRDVVDVDHVTSLQKQQKTFSTTPTTSTSAITAVDSEAADGSTIILNSHFQLQGGADANDVYKWHERQTRRQLRSRSHTYHTSLGKDQLISAIKVPGGFRRHFIQQEAVSRGQPAPQIPTKSFIHFLGLFNMHEFDRFAGENFHSIPKRSIIVYKDMDKQRLSMGESLESRRYLVSGEQLKDNEEAIEEPEEKISFSKAVGMLFKTGYCIFFAQQIAIVVASLGGAQLEKIAWIAIFFVILVPFTLVRNIGKLGFSTLVADLCIIVGLVYLYTFDIKALVINRNTPHSLPVFSYEGIGMVIPICSSMANPKQFPRALTIVLSVVCVLLVSFGCLGYAAYGENVQTIVLDDLPNETQGEKSGKNAIQLLYVIAIWLTTPLMLFPCIRIMEHAVFRVVGDETTGKVRVMKENAVRIFIDLAVAAVAYAGYTKLDIFISFIGSFACAPLLFIFPPMFHLRAFPGQPLWRKMSDVALILFGIIIFSYTLVITIQRF
ncbi:neutral amino acid transporter [Modicella reniformis]|uniref:Neutral amino acid transporter n=1 Tax=Modicella reniformis TaxID=1440133 RepID=A0A9P6ILS6_9FUNG|nr:neutral amino acid transporter [Modicella reniformis]